MNLRIHPQTALIAAITSAVDVIQSVARLHYDYLIAAVWRNARSVSLLLQEVIGLADKVEGYQKLLERMLNRSEHASLG